MELDKLLKSLEKKGNNLFMCAVCKHYLSVSPILYNDSIGSICGRESCIKFARSKGVCHPEKSYEAMCRHVEFPCINKENGCEKTVTMYEMKEHEKNCEFQKLLECALCQWSGETSDVYAHLKADHSSYKLDSFVHIDLLDGFECKDIYFCDVQDDLVIVRVEPVTNTLYFKVFVNLKHFGNLKYRIKVFNTDDKLLAASKFRSAEFIRPDVFNFSNEADTTWLKFDTASIRNFFENPSYLHVRFYVDDFEIDYEEDISYDMSLLSLTCLRVNCLICDKSVYCISSHLYNQHASQFLRRQEWHALENISENRMKMFHFDGNIFTLKMMDITIKYSKSIKYKYEVILMKSGSQSPQLNLSDSCIPAVTVVLGDLYCIFIPEKLCLQLFPQLGEVIFNLNIIKT